MLLLIPIVSFGAVSQFVFTTDIQTVSPNTISKDIKVQSQNSSGTEENVTETFDVLFESSSITGEFLNSSGNTVSKTMSKNTSNRTFYYRDSSVGEHTMTITFTGRDSKQTFKTSQKIKIGEETLNQNTNTKDNLTNTATDNSAHQSQSSASINSDEVKFDVSIGRDRFSSVGNELSFKAELLKLSGVSEQYIQYNWSFGDGSKSQGRIVSHKYKFPGEYNVVLNAVFSDKSAVARVKVSIIEPIIESMFVSGGIELLNKSKGEINLGNWTIENGNQRFLIPEDTILGMNKKIILPNDVVNIFGSDLKILNPLGQIISVVKKQDNLNSTSTGIILENLALNNTKKEEQKIAKAPVKNIKIVSKTNVKPKIENPVNTSSTTTISLENTKNTAVVYMAKPKQDMMGGVFSWFKNIFIKK